MPDTSMLDHGIKIFKESMGSLKTADAQVAEAAKALRRAEEVRDEALEEVKRNLKGIAATCEKEWNDMPREQKQRGVLPAWPIVRSELNRFIKTL
jgi:hypothetical protein